MSAVVVTAVIRHNRLAYHDVPIMHLHCITVASHDIVDIAIDTQRLGIAYHRFVITIAPCCGQLSGSAWSAGSFFAASCGSDVLYSCSRSTQFMMDSTSTNERTVWQSDINLF